MKRVINWSHYKENWADYGDAVSSVLFDFCVGLALIVLSIAAFFFVLAGFAPTDEEPTDGEVK